MTRTEIISQSFIKQAVWCEELGSPFTSALLHKIAADFDAKGICYQLCKDWPSDPIADALGLRICGGFHNLVLEGENPDLVQVWPPDCAKPNINIAWNTAQSVLQSKFAWFQEFIKSPPQTNEVRRSAAIFSGICAATSAWKGPIDILELGASAGLNQSLDKFEYSFSGFQSKKNSDVKIDTEWRGKQCMELRDLEIRNRAACDQNPLDVKNPNHALLLQSYIWPDQIERQARVAAAIKLAQNTNIKVVKEDAATWVKHNLQSCSKDALTIVFHSVFFNYPPEETRKAIYNNIRNEIQNATPNAPIIWLRFDNVKALFETRKSDEYANDFILDYVYKDFADGTLHHKILAKLDPHCRWIEWL